MGEGRRQGLAESTGWGVLMRSGFSNIVALMALVFSCWSYYETAWKADNLRLYAAPQIEFADAFNGPFDAFGLPITIANTGARSGVALSFEMTVENLASGEKKDYFGAEFGAWKASFQNDAEPFAPIAVAGRETTTRRILFFPKKGETVDRLVKTEPGTYRFTLTMQATAIDRLPVAEPEDRQVVLTFEMESPGFGYQQFNEGGSVRLNAPSYKTVSSQ